MEPADPGNPAYPLIPSPFPSCHRRALQDVLLLSLLVAGANALLAPGDPGWLGLNPSPVLFAALLIGGIHGLSWGVSLGALASLVILGCRLPGDTKAAA